MLAFLLWTFIGWRWAAVELMAEAAIGATIIGGGGGKILRSLKAILRDRATSPTPAEARA